MKTIIKFILPAVIVLALVYYFFSGSIFGFGGRKTTVGDITVSDISKTEKLKVLTVFKEILVEQTKEKPGTLFGKNEYKIATVFPARLDFGFDLSKCDEDWIKESGDSVIVNLPPIEILNKDGRSIDEAQKRVPIESGEWTNAEKEDFSVRAEALMRRNCIRDGYYKMAEEMGAKSIMGLIGALIDNDSVAVQIHIQAGNYPTAEKNNDKLKDPYKFLISGDNTYLKFDNGETLTYKLNGLTYDELFAFADYYPSISDNCKSPKLYVNSGTVYVIMNFKVLNSASPNIKADLSIVQNSAPVKSLLGKLHKIFEGKNLFLCLADKNGKILSKIK